MNSNVNIDLSRILDPAELWPDPEACPDWPLDKANVTLDGGSAQRRLEDLYGALNRSRGPVVEPTLEQARMVRDELFLPGINNNPRWIALGITNLKPAFRQEDLTGMIVEAAHIRGNRRKQEARQQRQTDAAEAFEQARHQSRLDAFPDAQAAVLAEIGQLSAGAARHMRLEQDERDYWSWIEAKRQLQAVQNEAVQAATALGADQRLNLKPLPVLSATDLG